MNKLLLEHLLMNASFVRWILREASEEEVQHWEEWLKEDPSHSQIVKEAHSLLNGYMLEDVDLPDVKVEWLKLERTLDQREKKNKVLSLRTGRSRFNRSKRLVAAALLVIGACLGAIFAYQYQGPFQADSVIAENAAQSQEYRTGYAEKVTFRLSDNSRIILNSNSHIRFSTNSDGKLDVKEVWLNGEAYFDINRREGKDERIFTVFTEDGSVSVLGTRFAVKTLEGTTRAVLEDGEIMVELAYLDSLNEQDKLSSAVLKPGDMALFSAGDESISIEQVNTRVYTSWYEGLLILSLHRK